MMEQAAAAPTNTPIPSRKRNHDDDDKTYGTPTTPSHQGIPKTEDPKSTGGILSRVVGSVYNSLFTRSTAKRRKTDESTVVAEVENGDFPRQQLNFQNPSGPKISGGHGGGNIGVMSPALPRLNLSSHNNTQPEEEEAQPQTTRDIPVTQTRQAHQQQPDVTTRPHDPHHGGFHPSANHSMGGMKSSNTHSASSAARASRDANLVNLGGGRFGTVNSSYRNVSDKQSHPPYGVPTSHHNQPPQPSTAKFDITPLTNSNTKYMFEEKRRYRPASRLLTKANQYNSNRLKQRRKRRISSGLMNKEIQRRIEEQLRQDVYGVSTSEEVREKVPSQQPVGLKTMEKRWIGGEESYSSRLAGRNGAATGLAAIRRDNGSDEMSVLPSKRMPQMSYQPQPAPPVQQQQTIREDVMEVEATPTVNSKKQETQKLIQPRQSNTVKTVSSEPIARPTPIEIENQMNALRSKHGTTPKMLTKLAQNINTKQLDQLKRLDQLDESPMYNSIGKQNLVNVNIQPSEERLGWIDYSKSQNGNDVKGKNPTAATEKMIATSDDGVEEAKQKKDEQDNYQEKRQEALDAVSSNTASSSSLPFSFMPAAAAAPAKTPTKEVKRTRSNNDTPPSIAPPPAAAAASKDSKPKYTSSWGASMFPKKGTWKCNVCNSSGNLPTATHCIVCEKPKGAPPEENPNDKKKKPKTTTAAQPPSQLLSAPKITAEPMTAVNGTKFQFGSPVNNDKTPTKEDTAAASISAGGFTFGGKVKSPPAPAGGFTFGGKVSSPPPPAGGFTFGDVKSDDKKKNSPVVAKPTGGFTFGSAPAASKETKASPKQEKTQPAKDDKSDVTPSKPAATSGFTFGSKAPDSKPAAASGGFSFGAAPAPATKTVSPKQKRTRDDETNKTKESKSPLNAAAPPFSFGGKLTAPSSTAAPSGGFSFGAAAPAPAVASTIQTKKRRPTEENSTKATPNFQLDPSLALATTAAPPPASSGFSFGAAKPSTTAPSFGTAAPSTSAPTTAPPAPAAAFVFGKTPTPAPSAPAPTTTAPPASTPGFTFGAAAPAAAPPSTTPATSGFTFGAGSAAAPAAPPTAPTFGTTPAPTTFGAAPPAVAPPAAQSNPSFQFGSAPVAPVTTAAPSIPGFGGAAASTAIPPATQGFGATPGFGFGNAAAPAAPPAAAPPSFGNQQPAAQPTMQFGAAPTQNFGGFGGAPAAPPAIPQQQASFGGGGFGAQAQAPSQPRGMAVPPSGAPGGFSIGTSGNKSKAGRRIVRAKRPKK